MGWQNHNIMRDYDKFNLTQSLGINENTDMIGLLNNDGSPKNFVFKYNTFDLYPTYCILPPDMLYQHLYI